LRGGYLVIPGANLTGVDLTGMRSGWGKGTSPTLPTDWNLMSGFLVGPNADLSWAGLPNANLSGANFRFVNFTNANLSNADFCNAIWNNTPCPDGSNSDSNRLPHVIHF